MKMNFPKITLKALFSLDMPFEASYTPGFLPKGKNQDRI